MLWWSSFLNEGKVTSNTKFPIRRHRSCRISLKVKMRKVLKKKPLPLKARFGIKPEVAIQHIQHPDTTVSVDVGWMTLNFGWDDMCSEAVLAVTKKDTFLLCAEPPTVAASLPRKRRDWVYAVHGIPVEFCEDTTRFSMLRYCGFEVLHGKDDVRRDFLSLLMPSGELCVLFRNPDSSSTEAWNRPTAVTFQEAMVVGPFDNAATLEKKGSFASTGDAELDRLLEKMG